MPRGQFSSPTLKLNITAEVWDAATRASSGGCIIAETIKQQYPHLSGVSVDMATIRVTDKKKGLRYTYLSPDSAQTLLLAYDQGWAQPDEHHVTIKTAVKTTKVQRPKVRAEARARRIEELGAKEVAGTLSLHEKSALTKLRKHPERATSDGKTEVAKDPNNRTVHGRAPRQAVNNPNLLKGRNRQFGKKIARPAVLFEQAVQKAAEERVAEMMAKG